jgi:hypothetical protein
MKADGRCLGVSTVVSDHPAIDVQGLH